MFRSRAFALHLLLGAFCLAGTSPGRASADAGTSRPVRVLSTSGPGGEVVLQWPDGVIDTLGEGDVFETLAEQPHACSRVRIREVGALGIAVEPLCQGRGLVETELGETIIVSPPAPARVATTARGPHARPDPGAGAAGNSASPPPRPASSSARVVTVNPGDVVDRRKTYDGNGNVVRVEEWLAGVAEPRVITQTYDDFDRLFSRTDADGRTVGYRYDLVGNLTQLIQPDGRVTRFTYDALDRVVAVEIPDLGTTQLSWLRDGRLARIQFPQGAAEIRTYDAAGRIATITGTQHGAVVGQLAYTYDANGNRLTQEEGSGGGASALTTYEYDLADRLASVTYPADPANPAEIVEYVLDRVGNRRAERTFSLGDGGPPVLTSDRTFTLDARHRLLAVVDTLDPRADESYEWDAAGNQIARSRGGVTEEFLYDGFNRLVEVNRGGSLLARYSYDELDRRTRAAGSGQVANYLWDRGWVLGVFDDGGNRLESYTRLGPRLLALEDSTAPEAERRQYYFLDALGSPTAIVRGDGLIQARYQWDAWGELRSQTGQSSGRFGFTGHEHDEATGLIYAKARYLDPSLGRFLSEDPFAGDLNQPPSLHRYLYAYANPTVYVDPDGRAADPRILDSPVWAQEAALNTLRDLLALPFRFLGFADSHAGFDASGRRLEASNESLPQAVGRVTGVADIRAGSQLGREGLREGDGEKVARGVAQFSGGTAQLALTAVALAEGGSAVLGGPRASAVAGRPRPSAPQINLVGERSLEATSAAANAARVQRALGTTAVVVESSSAAGSRLATASSQVSLPDSGVSGATVSDEVLGGSYRAVPANGGEVHHSPADSISPLSRGQGPGFRMETPDHRQTASWGNSREARAFRKEQKALIDQGRFKEAQEMDVKDVREKFGPKYDEGIGQMQNYTETIPEEKLVPTKQESSGEG